MIKEKNVSWDILSKYRGEIYGLTIIWIMLLHGSILDKVHFSPQFEWLYIILKHGNVGVDIFLFLSGIGLYYSFQKNTSLYEYMKKRLLRILLPYGIIAGVLFGYYYLYLQGDKKQFFMKFTTQNLWFQKDHMIWYVNMILLCYFIYPYIYAFFFERKENRVWLRCGLLVAATIVFTLLFEKAAPKTVANLEIVLTRLPIFFLGSAWGRLVYEKRKLPLWGIILSYLLVITSYPIFKRTLIVGIPQRYYYAILAIALCVVFATVCSVLSFVWLRKILCFFGGISFELYLIHIISRHIFMHSAYYTGNVWYRWLLMLPFFVLAAWLVSLIEKGIIRLFSDKKCKP